ncbi:MAG TPA: KamA family radical SAM protein [Thermoleophilaceae bacterium]|jgi:lysine 2,3-aminomutase
MTVGDSSALAKVPGSIPVSCEPRPVTEAEWWRRIPAYADVGRAEFHDHRWQSANSPGNQTRVLAVLRELGGDTFAQAAAEALGRAPMALRLTPYVLSLIDWSEPTADPIRRQFVPLAGELLPNHPMTRLDALEEQADMPVPGLVHRYPDRALLIALDVCPVYCAFCTRSYAVGAVHAGPAKLRMPVDAARWDAALDYLASSPQVKDVVLSGGDLAQLPARYLCELGRRLLDIASIRRIRLATRALGVLPMKLLSDEPWFAALCELDRYARRRDKEVALHVHLNHTREITSITKSAAARLFDAGITVRNQSVLLRGVNDSASELTALTRSLADLHITSYYVFQHDLVPRCEHLRTSLATALELEKQLMGSTAGFNVPRFVVDLPGGGGKRGVHTFESYDRESGVSVFTSPAVAPGRSFRYFDPLHSLTPAARARWTESATA